MVRIPERKKRGRPLKDRCCHLMVAATIDYRGVNEDELHFVFRNYPLDLVEKTFFYLLGGGYGIAKRAFIYEESDIVHRNAKGFWRIAVRLDEPNFRFCGLEEMKILIDSFFRRFHSCEVHWMTLDRFLNV